jgi:hypothetical protein
MVDDMTDNGLAALAAELLALDDDNPGVLSDIGIDDGAAKDAAAAILGERGVFLPDGLQGEPTQFAGIVWHDRYDKAAAEIATLRAQYAAQLNLTIETKGEIDTLRADAAATIDQWADALTEITTLRAALDRLVAAAQMAVPALAYGAPVQAAAGLGDPEPAFRAALATAKEAGNG